MLAVRRFAPLVLIGCANAEAPPAETAALQSADGTPQKTFEIAFQRAHATGSCGADGGPTAAAPILSADAAITRLREKFKGCYDRLLESDPEARGRLIEEIKIAPDGSVCAVSTSERIGLPADLATCIERIVASAQFMPPGGSGSPLSIPVPYVAPRGPNGPVAWPTLATPAIEHCAASAKQLTEATIQYSTDQAGGVGDLQIDPWKGDQDVLGCTADALRAVPHPPSVHFVVHARFQP